MIRDGEIERDRFFVETDARLGQAAEGFLQKTVALYRIALGWHMLLITHVDEIWPTRGQRQIMLSRTEFENATETIRELSTEKIIPHLIKVIQTIQWILDSCWSRGLIKIFQQIMHPGDVSSEHLRVYGRNVRDEDDCELPGTGVGRRRGVRYTNANATDMDVDEQDPALRGAGRTSNITQSPNTTGNGVSSGCNKPLSSQAGTRYLRHVHVQRRRA